MILEPQMADRRDNRRRARAEYLLHCAVLRRLVELVNRNPSLLNQNTPLPAERDNGIPGDARQNTAVEHRRHHRPADLEKDIHCADFFNIFSLNAVQPEHLRISLLMRLELSCHGCNIIAAGLRLADAAADGAHIIVLDPDLDRIQPLRIIRAYRR